jgi:hypothetical protein
LLCLQPNPDIFKNGAHPTANFSFKSLLSDPTRVGFEVLRTDQLQAYHRIGDRSVDAHHGENSAGIFREGRTPYCWWGTFLFPTNLKEEFPHAVPTVSYSTVGGRPVAVEIYEKEIDGGGWFRLEVYYDPAMGYIPRFVRYIFMGATRACKELYVQVARACKNGGFIPTEFYDVDFQMNPVNRVPADQPTDPRATAPANRVVVGHYQVTSFKEIKEPPALGHLSGVQRIVAQGGSVPLLSKAPLTAARIKSLLGRKLTDPRPGVGLNLDAAEIERFGRARPGWSWMWTTGLFAIGLAASLAIFWRRARQARSLVLVAIATSYLGLYACGEDADSVIHLTGRFDPPRILYDRHQGEIEVGGFMSGV